MLAQNDVKEFLFQFTPLREGRHRGAMFWAMNSKFQFTPLREGRRQN